MTIDRIPLWVTVSLLGFSPAVHAQDEIPTPKMVTENRAEEVSTAPVLPIFGWAEDRDLPIFDFDKIPSVLGNKALVKPETTKSDRFAISAEEKLEAKKDREIQHYARLFRIWTFESFRHDNLEYRRRVTTAQNMLRVWEYEGCDAQKRDLLKSWFHQAALASASGQPLPECDFLNPELLDQIAQGIPFTPTGGRRAGTAFARAMIMGSIAWAAPQGIIGTAMTMPLPFQLPNPAHIIGDEPDSATDSLLQPPTEPVADLEIAPDAGAEDIKEREISKEPESTPVQMNDSAPPNAAR